MSKLTPFMLLASAALITGCGQSGDEAGTAPQLLTIDGSSTVFPISEAMAEEYQLKTKTRVTVGASGTGGGFKKFCAGEIDITGASRNVKPTESEMCAANGVEMIELPVAFDGISVVIHPSNTWAKTLTVDQLKKIWEPAAQGVINNWNQIDPSFPDKKLSLFGPGVDSGTFDYFTKVINGETQASRGDYTASEDDNVLVHGVSTDEGALGYFGFAYYIENKGKINAVAIQNTDAEPVLPSKETIASGTYAPLSRAIFIYASKEASKRPEVSGFVDFYLGEGASLVEEVGYITLPEATAQEARATYAAATAQGEAI